MAPATIFNNLTGQICREAIKVELRLSGLTAAFFPDQFSSHPCRLRFPPSPNSGTCTFIYARQIHCGTFAIVLKDLCPPGVSEVLVLPGLPRLPIASRDGNELQAANLLLHAN